MAADPAAPSTLIAVGGAESFRLFGHNGLSHLRLIKLAAGGDPGREPVFAPERCWQLLVVPRCHIVVLYLPMLAEQAFYQVAMVIEDKDHRFQSIAILPLRGLPTGTSPASEHNEYALEGPAFR